MQKEQIERNIRLYAWFKIMREPFFWGPILISFILNIGKMELSELYFMEAVVVVAMVFVEIYSSAWADLLGRKKAILIGSFLGLIAVILFSLVNSPLLVWIANIFIMVGYSITSGVDEAFLVETLKEAGRSDEYTKINGRIMARRFMIIAFTCIASGYLYSINPRLPMFLSIPGVFVSFLVVFFFVEPKTNKKVSHKEHFDLMKMSILFVANNKKVKWIIGYIALIALASKLWFFTYNPYFELTDLDPKFFGWIFAAINIVAWASSKYAHVIEKKFSELTIIILLPLLLAVPIILMGAFVFQLSIILILSENLTRGFREPFFSSFINRHLDSKNRATVLSIKSASRALISAVGLWSFGIVLTKWQLSESLLILGMIVLLFAVYSIWRYRIIFRN